MNDSAFKILPVLSMLTVDSEKTVRDQVSCVARALLEQVEGQPGHYLVAERKEGKRDSTLCMLHGTLLARS